MACMYTIKDFLKYWLPVLLWMLVIFLASQDAQSYEHSSFLLMPLLSWFFPHLEQLQIDAIHSLFRKGAHLSEYAMLALLLWRAIRHTKGKRQAEETQPTQSAQDLWQWDRAGLVLSIVFLYASTDEFHQIFIPARGPSLWDVCIDTSGGAVALLALWIFELWRKKG